MKNIKTQIKDLPRNIWAVSLTSFFMDISSEMVINLIPLFLSNALGVKTNIIGLIEGVAESTASILKVFSGWLSDKLKARKWPAVLGYALSAFSKPFFYLDLPLIDGLHCEKVSFHSQSYSKPPIITILKWFFVCINRSILKRKYKESS